MNRWMTGALALAAMATIPLVADAQTTLAQGTGGTVADTIHFYGQSFTAATTGTDYNNIVFQNLNTSGANTGTETGNLYLFSAPYSGTPAGLSSSTGLASYVGTATGSSNGFSFDPGLILTGGNQYFSYPDSVNPITGEMNTYANGGYAEAFSSTGSYTSPGTLDLNFRATGTAVSAAPEPGTWAMMILGFGIAGTALRRRRRIDHADGLTPLAA